MERPKSDLEFDSTGLWMNSRADLYPTAYLSDLLLTGRKQPELKAKVSFEYKLPGGTEIFHTWGTVVGDSSRGGRQIYLKGWDNTGMPVHPYNSSTHEQKRFYILVRHKSIEVSV